MRADTIYKNGSFYTENKTAPWAEAVAIEGKNLIAVGTESDCTAFADEKTRIQDFTDHACWLNSAALELLKDGNGEIHIETDAVEPNFKKDDNGEYTGWVQEPFDAIDEVIYEKLGWYPPQEITDEMVDPLLDYFKAHGITCMMDGLTTGEDAMRYFCEKDRKGELGMFYDATSILTSADRIDEAIATAREWQEKYGGEHIRCNTIKFFIDGTNELGDCLSLEPFANDPTGTNFGHSYATEDEMVEVMLRINDAGMDLHVHTICDGAFRLMCNAYERARAQRPDSWQMFLTLTHCELIDPEDMERVARLGIFIDWSPHWSGGYFGEEAREYLGDRWYRMYDFTGIIAAGGVVGFSSDVFTYQEAGKLANPIVLNKNIFETPAEEIAGVDAQLVIYEGKERIVTSSLNR